MVIGGWAVIHHGFERTTSDVDLLVDSSVDNFQKIRSAMLKLPDGAIREVAPSANGGSRRLPTSGWIHIPPAHKKWQHLAVRAVSVKPGPMRGIRGGLEGLLRRCFFRFEGPRCGGRGVGGRRARKVRLE